MTLVRDFSAPNPYVIDLLGRKKDALLAAERECLASHDRRVRFVGVEEAGVLPSAEILTLEQVRQRILAVEDELAEAAGQHAR